MTQQKRSSSGHKLGQLIGDWFEEDIAAPLLEKVAFELNLYLDHRFKKRSCRGNKIIWQDLDENDVDYDFVLELGGSDDKKGIPVAFFETFWRRGARHSKDKARDDSGKLMPMRDTYPTARVLGIISAGDFTRPAQELVHSRHIDLFYIPKEQICNAWESAGITMDYDDRATESTKNEITENAILLLDSSRQQIFNNLCSSVGSAVFESYINRIIAGVSALPMQYNITSVWIGDKLSFQNYNDVINYIDDVDVNGEFNGSVILFRYEVIFSDGTIFERVDLTADEALELHNTVGIVAKHFS
ncbi:hypothetical protein C9J19_18380 [Photobacterium phosphoreum]|uniref:hypothetical protein n=1 Tax=Photobacterium phosphoreum TaxID=659 RepID=UPI000D160D9F|nr:hypothetical protein [Photobacterium phosphoreum]PSW25757.1 hypothetical protein C9J19_18380 [Photobacterium phosphoreum]